ncbi:MAG: hypothetical protein NTW21_44840 [Verrucomicrobia bacterium]|nr:hypothetical protein [Verrucomicrobiota bacterium]
MLSHGTLYPKSFEVDQDIRRQLIRIAPPRKTRPPAWPVIRTGKPQIFELTRDKAGKITKVFQHLPFPRSGDADDPGHRYDAIVIVKACRIFGTELEKGCVLDLAPYAAMQLLRENSVQILTERKP